MGGCTSGRLRVDCFHFRNKYYEIIIDVLSVGAPVLKRRYRQRWCVIRCGFVSVLKSVMMWFGGCLEDLRGVVASLAVPVVLILHNEGRQWSRRLMVRPNIGFFM